MSGARRRRSRRPSIAAADREARAPSRTSSRSYFRSRSASPRGTRGTGASRMRVGMRRRCPLRPAAEMAAAVRARRTRSSRRARGGRIAWELRVSGVSPWLVAAASRTGQALSMGAFVDLSGQRFGRLRVVRRVPMPAHVQRRPIAFWEVQCDCGAPAFVTRSDALRSGRASSCGCSRSDSQTIHGRARAPIYRVWQQMIQRCHNPRDAWFFNYGARGLTVCDRWRESFENFLADVGERPSGATLDRIDNDRGYEPGNVRWASRTDQMNNTRANRLIEHAGRRMTISQWSRELGIPKSTIQGRAARGLPVHEVLSARSGRP